MVIYQPTLSDGLSLIGWRLKRDAEIRARQGEANFECDVEPSSTSYAAFEHTSVIDDDYDPYAGLHPDLCLEVDALDLNASSEELHDDYDPYEVFMRQNTRRTALGRDRTPLAALPSASSSSSFTMSNFRHYNFAEDDTPVKYPLAIGPVDRRSKPQSNIRGELTSTTPARSNAFSSIRRLVPSQYPTRPSLKRVAFRRSVDELDADVEDSSRRQNPLSKRAATQTAVQRFRDDDDEDLDADIAPTVTEMDMLEDDEDEEPVTRSMSSPAKPPPPSQNKPPTSKSSYIGNLLPSFYEQLPASKKMLLQDATVDSSSHSDGPGGEEIVDEEHRLQFRHTTMSAQGYRRVNHLPGTKRYHGYDDDDDDETSNLPRKRSHAYPYRHDDDEYQQTVRGPARRGRPPSQQHQEDPSKKSARLLAQFEEQHGLTLGDMRVYAPKLRLRISNVNVNWINLPSIPKFPNKVHPS